MSTTTVLIPVGDEPEMLEWLEEFGLRPHSRALRFPTLGELRTAARSTNPTSMEERSSHGTWYAFLCQGSNTGPPGHPRDDGGGFELNAEVDPLDDGSVVTSVGFRGRHDKMDAVAEAIAAVIGPVVTVEDSSGLPRLHGNR